MKDTRGTELNVGDLVAYGARSGNTGELRIAIVTNVDKKAIISGDYRKKWDVEKRTYSDEYEFNCSGVQGFGVDDAKLLKLDPVYYNDVYAVLLERANKWLPSS